ncbi:hypothetical protein ACJ73_08631 [Blastomyces percursus]|uniref:Uncharacterized protein n=1 Tax=Blastomyces percursus TaxID=1658174 RepID=A0A1J9QTV7_9EURO|nr:hypothetical protein ACJ73_08631 [Blastomyces percursus]
MWAVSGECNNQTEAADPEAPPVIQPASNPADLLAEPVKMEPHPSGFPGMEDIQLTPPLAHVFEDTFSAPLDKKTVISVHRSARDILRMWTGVFTAFHNLLAKDHYFMSTDKQTVQSLANKVILLDALDKKLLFVGSKSCPGRKGTEPLGSVEDL